jgi:hypothetical protein
MKQCAGLLPSCFKLWSVEQQPSYCVALVACVLWYAEQAEAAEPAGWRRQLNQLIYILIHCSNLVYLPCGETLHYSFFFSFDSSCGTDCIISNACSEKLMCSVKDEVFSVFGASMSRNLF